MTSAAPSRERGGGVRLVGQQRARAQQPAADVVHDGRAERASSLTDTTLVNPSTREVARVHLEHRAGVGPERVGVVGRWVRFVVPTSRRRAPRRGDAGRAAGSRRRSRPSRRGSRRTSPPAARAVVASTRAAAPLLTTRASSASGTARAARRPARRPPAPPPGREVELDVDGAAAVVSASMAAAVSGARPRLVCSTTPVALSTGGRVVERAGGRRARPRRRLPGRSHPRGRAPGRCAPRP